MKAQVKGLGMGRIKVIKNQLIFFSVQKYNNIRLSKSRETKENLRMKGKII